MSDQYTISFQRKREVARGTFEFIFSKPDGFVYEAGQNMDWELVDPKENDSEGTMRTFSLTSAPHEDHISFATRMRNSAFKRQIAVFQESDQIKALGPNGTMTLQPEPAVFLAGGIGITPFLSMLKDAVRKELQQSITLFYSNRNKADSPFFDEVQHYVQRLVNGTFVPTMTDDESFSGEHGYINDAMLKKYIKDITVPVFYLAGPPAMVNAMYKMLQAAGAPRLHIISENFDGYEKNIEPLA